MIHGEYIITLDTGKQIILPNTIVGEGAEQFLAELFKGTAAASLHMGLCNQVPDNSDVLVDIATEPTIGVGGYARVPLARNSTDWPTIASANGESFVTSKAAVFTASGADFDAPHSRLFMCDQLTGFVGTLFSYSAALPSEVTQLDGTAFTAQYRFFLS